MFWAGAFTLFELARYDLAIPMGDQGLILLPHLASLGLGLGEAGTIVNTEPYIAIAAFHLVSSAVLGAAGIWHTLRAPKDLSEAEGRANRFHFEWDDPKKLTFILGHHLIFLGLGVIAFVEWAKRHGIYDTASGAVRKVEPPMDLGMVWGDPSHFLTINSGGCDGRPCRSGIHSHHRQRLAHRHDTLGPFKKVLIYSGRPSSPIPSLVSP